MKQIILIILFAFSISANAQDNTTVTLIASGQGKTSVEAKQFALRSAIEQAFGAFISSKTEILNDSLVKDEVTMISSGTVLDYIVLNESKLSDNSFSVTLNATVSISSLKKIAESKGEIVTFSGALFGMKIKIAKLQKDAEIKVIENLCKVSSEILAKSIDFKLEIGEPIKANIKTDIIEGSRYAVGDDELLSEAPMLVDFNDSNQYKIRVIVENRANKNLDVFIDFFSNTLQSIKMSSAEIEFAQTSNLEYSKFNLNIYKGDSTQSSEIYLRSQLSHEIINKFMYYSINHLIQYKIHSDNNFIDFSLLDYEKYVDLFKLQGYPNNYYNILEYAQELYIKPDCFVNIRAIIPFIDYPDQYCYPDRKDIREYLSYPYEKGFLLIQDKYNLFYSDFKDLAQDGKGQRYEQATFKYGFAYSLVYAKEVEFKKLSRDYNWNTRYQVYDFYLLLSELEKIKEIKVEPYTGPSDSR